MPYPLGHTAESTRAAILMWRFTLYILLNNFPSAHGSMNGIMPSQIQDPHDNLGKLLWCGNTICITWSDVVCGPLTCQTCLVRCMLLQNNKISLLVVPANSRNMQSVRFQRPDLHCEHTPAPIMAPDVAREQEASVLRALCVGDGSGCTSKAQRSASDLSSVQLRSLHALLVCLWSWRGSVVLDECCRPKSPFAAAIDDVEQSALTSLIEKGEESVRCGGNKPTHGVIR